MIVVVSHGHAARRRIENGELKLLSAFAAVGVPLPSPAPGTTTPGVPAAEAPSNANVTPAGTGLAEPYIL